MTQGHHSIQKFKQKPKSLKVTICFYNHTQIRSTFWNENLNSKGDTLRIYAFSYYFNFYKTTLKTPKTNFIHLDKLYTFAFRLDPKICLDFELGFSRLNLNAENRVFENPNQYKALNSIHSIQVNTYNHKSKLVLVNA